MSTNITAFPGSRTCPHCGAVYRAYPAISRRDNRTEICPDCGIREALNGIGVPADEQEHILQMIHWSRDGR